MGLLVQIYGIALAIHPHPLKAQDLLGGSYGYWPGSDKRDSFLKFHFNDYNSAVHEVIVED